LDISNRLNGNFLFLKPIEPCCVLITLQTVKIVTDLGAKLVLFALIQFKASQRATRINNRLMRFPTSLTLSVILIDHHFTASHHALILLTSGAIIRNNLVIKLKPFPATVTRRKTHVNFGISNPGVLAVINLLTLGLRLLLFFG